MDLTERDLAILDFERTWWSQEGSKEAMIRARFGVSSTRYYRWLHDVIDSPAALAHDPLVVRRLRRSRDQRRQARHERHGAGGQQR